MGERSVDLCVIGAGAGGLSVAAGASQMGASTLLIEKGVMGGDCLNYGCVPSKALLAAGHAADAMRRGERFGITAQEPAIDPKGVYGHVQGVIAGIAPHDSQERFEGLGVTVLRGAARFVDGATVAVGDDRIRARRFVIATGSSALVPPIPGLDGVDYLTNETLFDLPAIPEHLLIIGGGPIGVEMAQAHRHLGARVTLLEAATLMPRDDQELVDVVRKRLRADGITLHEGAKVTAVGAGPSVTVEGVGEIAGSHVLVAAGRRPNIEGLDLDKAGIAADRAGITVDGRLRTTNKKVFAIGDVAGGMQFTHVAGYHAGIIIKNALFRMPAKADMRAVPWVTYSSPELAGVGLSEEQAMAKHSKNLRVLRWSMGENDRARAEAETEGMIKVLVTKKGQILGATIVGARAGELIQVWALALSQKLKIGAVAQMIAPYPTLGELNKRAAGTFYTPTLFSKRTRGIVRFLSRFG
ncbi:NAD(P)/FAD-dependent oxidoreductase [Magnetospira sp. QH-2]|uniref:dihydrolipoyl dehydrogenase family protein n=1 Tax=Magnetospira sp. (strain QH-2) TaxID=1288970 RepID=UPI0003E80E27|nr:FAD-dependent oxidoreductase [Magnetospira sp. QH-2]CCQ72115.1 putative dihydrolipoyl dehydrogenase [Magnetospira sp. QH-2]